MSAAAWAPRDPALTSQRLELHGTTGGLRVVGGEHDPHRIGSERAHLQTDGALAVRIIRIPRVAERDRDVRLTGPDGGDGLRRLGLHERHAETGVFARDAGKQLRDEHRRRGREGDEPNPTAAQPGEVGELFRGRAQSTVDRLGMTGEDPAGLSQADPAPDPLDDGRPDAVFDTAQLLADGGLTQSEQARCTGDRTGDVDRADDQEGTGIECGTVRFDDQRGHDPTISPGDGFHRNLVLVVYVDRSDTEDMASSTLDVARSAFPSVHGYLAACTLGLPTTGTTEALTADIAAWERAGTDAATYGALVERVRASYAQLVGSHPRNVAIGSQTSAMVAIVAASAPDGAEILCVDGDFSSVIAPFLMHAHRGVRVRHAPLAELADHIDRSTWLVAYSAVQSSTGAVADMPTIRAAAAAHGALTLCDLTQAAGWLPVDATADDITVCHAYKWLCSPRGVAFLTVRDAVMDRLLPVQAGWYSGADVWASCYGPALHLAEDARRFDVSPAWQAWVGAEPAIALFAALDLDEVRAHNTGLAARMTEGLGIADDASPDLASAIVTWDDPDGTDLEALRTAGITASGRAGRARVGFHLWNTEDDVSAALAALGHPRD